MQRVIVNMQNFVFSEAIEQALLSEGDFSVTVVEKPHAVPEACRLLAADALLMEVTACTPWKMTERMKIREKVKSTQPGCKIVLLVDEKAEKKIAEQVKQAKRDGLIDQFIYGSTSASFLAALMDTL
jgi:AmiR/NasT family two-component response regulator